jgi:hypothetical protein
MTLLVSFVRGIGSVPSLLPQVQIGSIAWVTSGPTVTLHPRQSKGNQCLVHLRERTSITGKLVPDNLRGEGARPRWWRRQLFRRINKILFVSRHGVSLLLHRKSGMPDLRAIDGEIA